MNTNKQNNPDNKPEPQRIIHWNKLGSNIVSKKAFFET